MNKPLLSIIIPTKNRYSCLKEVINCLLTFKNNNVEFVIQDNTPDNEVFLRFINNINDDRFKYFYTKENLAIIDNSDKAIINSRGEYLCFIGDDDIILENIVDMVSLMVEKDIECLIQESVTYYWQDINFKYANKSQQPGSFLITEDISGKLKRIDEKDELKKVIESGGTQIGRLPRIYHGIVKRTALDTIFDCCNTYFPGPSPDMASSVALAHFTTKNYHIQLPFTISGKSAVSTSGMGVAHTHVGKLDNLDFLPKDIISTWDNNIPLFWSCSTIWAQSLYSALKACKSIEKINYFNLYTNLLVFERGYTKETEEKINEIFKGNKVINYFILYKDFSIIFMKRVLNYLKRKYISDTGNTTHNGINSILECYNIVNKILREKDIKKLS